MATQNEPIHTLEFLLSEANGQRSRDAGTASAAIAVGAVVELDTGEWKPIANEDPAGKTLGIAIGTAVENGEVALIVRDAEVDGGAIEWGALVAGADRTAAIGILASAGIIIR